MKRTQDRKEKRWFGFGFGFGVQSRKTAMDELEFRKLLDLFPVVRSRDYHVRLPLSLSLLFFISTFHSFPLSNLQSTIILKTHISIEFFWNNIYIFFNLNIRQNQRRQESQPLSQCRMRRYDSTLLYYRVFMYWVLIIDVFEFTTGKGMAECMGWGG